MTPQQPPGRTHCGMEPRIRTLLASAPRHLTAGHGKPRRGGQGKYSTFFQLPINSGSVCGGLNRSAESIKQAYEHLLSEASDHPSFSRDEINRPQNRRLSWLWMFVAPLFVVFKIDPRNYGIFAGKHVMELNQKRINALDRRTFSWYCPVSTSSSVANKRLGEIRWLQ